MSNYYAVARTNYFKVKNENEFKKFMETFLPSMQIVEKVNDNGEHAYCVLTGIDDGFPSIIAFDSLNQCPEWINKDTFGVEDIEYKYDDGSALDIQIHFPYFIANFIADREVVISMEIGHEKMRCLNGYASAVNSKFEKIEMSLSDIHTMAANKFTEDNDPTFAEY